MIAKNLYRGIFFLLFPLFSLFCCASDLSVGQKELTSQERMVTSAIVEAARGFVGVRSLVVNGKRFNFDCTGGVLASYYRAGIDLWPLMAPYSGNGVRRLWMVAKDNHWVIKTAFPSEGDLIFWDNTYDKNGNGLFDDDLTHVGLVVSVSPDGTIEYFHHHITRGFVIEKMNLMRPDVFQEKVDGRYVIVNAAIRAGGLNKSSGYLSGQLFRGFGQAWRSGF